MMTTPVYAVIIHNPKSDFEMELGRFPCKVDAETYADMRRRNMTSLHVRIIPVASKNCV